MLKIEMTTKLIELGKLMRLNKPIGTFLLLWPTLTAFVILKEGSPNLALIVIFCVGTFLMRSAGCVINDFFDKDFDGRVERTKDRPLVTGLVSRSEALMLFFFLVSLSASLLFWTNRFTVLVALLGLVLSVIYPLTKRFFKIPQLFLGLVFSWGILMVSAAELNSLPLSSFIMFSACFFWILAYDTAYAMSDLEGDLSIGLNSSAITFGEHSAKLIVLFHLISLALWTACGILQKIGLVYYLGILLVLLQIPFQYQLVKTRNPENCLLTFKRNNWIGISILLGSFLSYLIEI